jgi:hypothetical protein
VSSRRVHRLKALPVRTLEERLAAEQAIHAVIRSLAEKLQAYQLEEPEGTWHLRAGRGSEQQLRELQEIMHLGTLLRAERAALLNEIPEVSERRYWHSRYAKLESVYRNLARMYQEVIAAAAGCNWTTRVVSTPVVLWKPHEKPVVRGNEKRPLRITQFNVVQALLKAGESGLTKDALIRSSGHTDALGILKRLKESDSDWGAVIHFADKPGGHYRIS